MASEMELMEARYLAELGYLEEIFIAMGYENVHVYEKSKDLPFHTLVVGVGKNEKNKEIEIVLMFYPTLDFDNTLFLQYYLALTPKLDDKSLGRVYPFLPFLNQRLVIGHFGVAAGDQNLYFRYVQALNSSDLITLERIEDVFKLFYSTALFFGPILEKLAAGGIDFQEACDMVLKTSSNY